MNRLFFLFLLSVVTIFQSNAYSPPVFYWASGITTSTYLTEMSIGQSIASDQNNDIYATGHFRGTMDFNARAGTALLTSDGREDIYVSKSTAWGDLIWVRKMGSSGSDQGFGIVLDDSSNIYITGFFEDTVDFDPGPAVHQLVSNGGADFFVCKLDFNGNFVWAKSIGGTDDDKGAAICVNQFDVYLTGSFQGSVDFDPGSGTTAFTSKGFKDIFVLKLKNNGNFEWAGQMGGTSDEAGMSILADGKGNTYTAGYFHGKVDFDPSSTAAELVSKSGNTDAFVLKLDASGNFVWAKQTGGGAKTYNYGITADKWGNIYTTGAFTDTADFDPNAGTSNLSSIGLFDAFVCKLDSNGNFLWAKQMGGTDNDFAYSIVVNDMFDVFTVGSFEGKADFDTSVAHFYLTSNGKRDIFISKLDSSGNFIWADKGGGLEDDVAVSIAGNRHMCGSIYLTGFYNSKGDFKISTAVLPDANNYGIFTACYGHCVLDIVESEQSNRERQLRAYPSPFTHRVYIESQDCQHVAVYNTLGQKVLDLGLKTGVNELNADYWCNGLYFIRNEKGDIVKIEKKD